jgi:hypothetical protein
MRALTKFMRVGAAALICAAVLAAAVVPGRAQATDPRDVSWWIHNEIDDRQTSDTVNGVTTETQSFTSTTHATSSDGESVDDVQTHQTNADGSGSEHEKVDNINADGSSGTVDRGDTWDSNGNRFHQGTESVTDADGNRTTWTYWEQFDSHGRSLRKGEDVKKDKVTPPTPRVKSAAPASSAPAGTASAPGQSATPGSSASQPTTGEPDYWTGTITYRFAGSAGGPDYQDLTNSGTYDDSATFTVVLTRDSPTSSDASWSVANGTVTGSVNDDLRQTDPSGGLWRMTLNGGGWGSVPKGACHLTFAADRGSYSIGCRETSFGAVEYVGYEGENIEEGPRTVTWSPPSFSLEGISMPSGSAALSGSRKADVWAATAGSKPVAVQADVSWNLTPGSGSAPTTPPDITGSVKINDPPYPVSITHPGQRVVVGFPVLAGQKVTVRVTGNTIGEVKVSLVKSSGDLVTVSASGESSFDLLAQTLGTSGTCSIVVEPKPGNSGDISLAVTSP